MKALLQGLTADGQVNPDLIRQALSSYADMLHPWAGSVARYMVADVTRRNAAQWKALSATIGKTLRTELTQAPTGAAQSQLMQDSVNLIKSLPLRAAEQVHELVQNNLPTGARASTLIPKIMELGAKTEAQARVIARTEVSRASCTLTQARAEFIGSEGYIWRTVGDGDVRDSHADMEGRYVRWDTVPTLSDGTKTHAGCIYNCRCYPEPIVPDF